eukprot:comp22133_c0_seq4/m.51723 comp22133_c0_seq4/g.51723  ORF comp22133_c0_seq4/g.51723 comp22133_c0_seq4/m.51723 type:complete len:541 (-) comp22133_c0_seq4:140-1762(-)
MLNYFHSLPGNFGALCDEFFPSDGSDLSFKLFLMLLYKFSVPQGNYSYTRTRTQVRRGSTASRPEDTDLWKMLEKAFQLVQQDFARFDVDGDNAVDIHEMTSAMKDKSSGELIQNISNLQRLFSLVDVDGSGFIDFREFLYLVYELTQDGSYRSVVEKAADAAAVKSAFNYLRSCYVKYDSDQSGRLDMKEATKFAAEQFGSIPAGYQETFMRIWNPTKGTVDLVSFFFLLYSVICPNGSYVNKKKIIPKTENPARADLPKPSGAAQVKCRRVMPLRIPDIQKGKELGKGGFGVVYKAELQGMEVAAKFLLGDYSDQTVKEFSDEVSLMERFSDPNVVFLVGYANAAPDLVIVTELCANGSLFDIIQKQGRRLGNDTVIRLATEIARGLRVLHKNNPPIIHRDLKSLNVLVDADFHAKLADFGLSTIQKRNIQFHTPGVIGTPCWAAPEVLSNKPYDSKADIYSYGIMLWEMAHRQLPYYDMPQLGITQIMYAVVEKGLRPKISPQCHPGLAALMRKCWDQNPANRPDIDAIIATLQTMV